MFFTYTILSNKYDFFLSESRYLLLLTENYGALAILEQNLFTMQNAVVIFGSSFPSDQEYTQVRLYWTCFTYSCLMYKINTGIKQKKSIR